MQYKYNQNIQFYNPKKYSSSFLWNSNLIKYLLLYCSSPKVTLFLNFISSTVLVLSTYGDCPSVTGCDTCTVEGVCDSCSGGYSKNAQNTCTICPVNKYAAAGSSSCSYCTITQYAPQGSTSCSSNQIYC